MPPQITRDQWREFFTTARKARHRRMEIWGDLLSSFVMESVYLAHLDGASWDMTSLAADLRVSRMTASRLVKSLVGRGFLEILRRGRATRVIPTKAGIDLLIGRRGQEMVRLLIVLCDSIRPK